MLAFADHGSRDDLTLKESPVVCYKEERGQTVERRSCFRGA